MVGFVNNGCLPAPCRFEKDVPSGLTTPNTKRGHITIDINLPNSEGFCFQCLGTGKLKAMQMAMTYDVGPVRTNDKTIECNHCKGSGSAK